MARAKKHKHTKPNKKQATPSSVTSVTKTPKEVPPRFRKPSKNEIMFFRIGMLSIALTVVIVTVIFVVNYFKDPEFVGPFDEMQHLTMADLTYIVGDNGDGTYGDFTYFMGREGYEDVYEKLMGNPFIYIYFYRSSDINEDIVQDIESIEGFDTMAFFLVDMDRSANAELLTDPDFAHLGLWENNNHQLITYDIENEDGAFFTLDPTTSQVRITLKKLG
ncbi:MAG: hypothetical protein EA375_05645 [Acholeplasmataceae bacterium]|nr:MAG: hypothetical protein EA375_05645 [Acholeplasmataceae bacterium]